MDPTFSNFLPSSMSSLLVPHEERAPVIHQVGAFLWQAIAY